MTNEEIIAKFRAEIARLQPNAPKPGNMKSVDAKVAMQVHARLNKLLSFISYLEKSLPAKVADGEELNGEIEYYLDHADLKTKCNGISAAQDYFDDLANTARHFYDLGCRRTAEKYDEIEYERQRAEESEKSMNQVELQKEIEKYFPESAFNTGFNYDDMQEIASHFAKWGAEHLKK